MAAVEPPSGQSRSALHHFQKLRNFTGDQGEFWGIYLRAQMDIAQARAGLVAMKSAVEPGGWKIAASLPGGTEEGTGRALALNLATLAQRCVPKGFGAMNVEEGMILAVNVLIESDPHACVALLLVDRLEGPEAKERIGALISINDLPGQIRLQQSAFEALKNQNKLADILDLLVLINGEKRFVAAAMIICNELAARFRCDRVALGWLKNGYVRIAAFSHADQFGKKMTPVQQLEQAMEEAIDQECEIVLPAPEGNRPVTRDSEVYAKAADARFLATLPVRAGEAAIAAVTLERSGGPFDEAELRHLRIMLDQTSTRLREINRIDRWFGPRLADWCRDRMAGFLGYKHTWAKALGLAGGLFLLVVCLVPVRYRVDSPMILRTNDITYITAPFDGFIDSVAVRPGDVVTAGEQLLSLDTKDLRLEEAGLLAEKNRQEREIEKARAASDLAEMLIAQARFDQAVAKLDINEFKIGQAGIQAPYDGVVIEGDQAEKIGSPVKVGEILFKVGRIRNIYAEAKVSENEIQNVRENAEGQIALASRPQDPFDVRVSLIEPTAIPTQKDNAFNVRCAFKDSVPGWFRPGMTGVSKINAGRKTLFWIATHRTIDFLRLKLWW